uniref:Dynein regulatory complex subunit 4 n=1 Tax=Hucho hucho TaxID=62062 RepID=A0A4W5RI07_9TELE
VPLSMYLLIKPVTDVVYSSMPSEESRNIFQSLEEHIVRLREELDREREERNYFQLERDKIHTFWEITKRHLDERKADLRNRDREMEEAEEHHQVEIKVYVHCVVCLTDSCQDLEPWRANLTNCLHGLFVYQEQMEEMTRKEERLEKDMAEVLLQNKRLTEPLQRAKEEVTELQKQQANYEKDKTSLAGAKARLKVADKEIKDLKWEHEVLGQRFSKVQVERDDLYKKFTQAIQEVQQQSGFKNLLLERKLGALTNTLEKKEAQLNEVLFCNQTTLFVFSLQEVLDSKNIAIKDLQYELARVCKARNDLLRTYEARLQAFGIPMEELGFKPLESSVAGHLLGQGPAGLVSAPT